MPHNCCGPDLAQGSKGKPASRVSAATSEQSEGQSNTKGDKQLARPGPHRGGPDILKLCI
jgi:hypothetical protein